MVYIFCLFLQKLNKMSQKQVAQLPSFQNRIIEIVFIVLIAVVCVVYYVYVPPAERGLHCSDHTIRLPIKNEEQVPSYPLLVALLIVVYIFIILNESIRHRLTKH